jgi:hypothetical protein
MFSIFYKYFSIEGRELGKGGRVQWGWGERAGGLPGQIRVKYRIDES